MNTLEGYRLSPQQRRIWSLRQAGASVPYCAQCAVAISGELDRQRLTAAVQAVVDQHEILRTTFRYLPGMTVPLQVVDAVAVVSIHERDLSGPDHAPQLAALAQELRQTPFDAEHGPLWHLLLVTLSRQEHVLLICMDALCADAAGLRNMVREISRAYAASQDAPEPLQYADIAEWQNTLFEEDNAAVGKSYWRERSPAEGSAWTLPFERPVPVESAFSPDVLALPISPARAAHIQALAQQYQVQIPAVLLAVWSCLFWRIAEQQALPIGVACDGRKYEDVVDALGSFARYVPIQPALTPELHFQTLLRQIDEALAQAYTWQDYFAWDDPSAGAAAFFPIGFDFEAQPAQYQAAGVTFSIREQSAWLDRFNIRLSCAQLDGSLRAAIYYDAQRLAAPDIAQLAESFQTLLESATSAPEQPIAALAILSDAQRQRLLIDLNATATAYPATRFVHHLFEEQAQRTPDSTAVWFKDQSLSYAALNVRANQLARSLQRRGVGPEVPVALGMERSPDLVVGLLAILKAGGAYVPLDPQYPQQRLAFLLADTRAPVLLTHTALDDGRWTRAASIICLDSDWAAIAQECAENLRHAGDPANIAYIIYTSGSTGLPKGVMIPHQGLTNYLHWCSATYPITAGRGAPVHSSIAFDLTITSLLAPLVVGRGVMLLPEEDGIEALEIALRQHGDWSLVKLTPAHLELLSRQVPAQQAARTKAFIIGGEDLRATSIAFWQDAAPDTLLINEYGPTETVVGCCVYRVPAGEQISGSVPIGRPIANTQLYLLDGQLRPVPLGVPGEVFIGGVQLARGYLGRPDLTAERFVPNPFATPDAERRTPNAEPAARPGVRGPASGVRLYRTGDRARYRADGQLVFLGRRDSQVKLRGFRIELGEIAAALRMHPAVRDAAVRLHAAGDAPQLVAYVVPIADAGRTPHDESAPASVLRPAAFVQDVRDHLSQQLPAYLLPHAVVVLAALPLTPNGKLDHRALPAPDRARPALTSAFVAPRTSAEATLAAIWARLLRRTLIGVTDNFFALGGDSILSIQIIAAAREAGLYLTPKDMFQHQTVAALAAVAGRAPAVLAEQGLVRGAVPLTPIQHAFFAQDLPAPQHYTQALLLTLRQPLALALLTAALAALLAQHDALRLRFVATAAGWQQVHADAPAVPVQQVDLRGLAPPRQRAALEGAAAALQRSLDLTHGPLVRVAHFVLGADEPARLLLIIHHLLVDGVSWRILLADLHRAATQLAAGEAVQLPPKTSAYQTWAQRLAAYAQSAALRAERAYWLALVRPVSRTLPRDHATGPPQIGTAAEVVGQLTPDETRTLLEDVPAAYHTQINDALLMALVQAVGGWSGEARLLVELEGHGREELFPDVDLTRTVGWYTATYPVLLDVRGAAGPGAALQAVKEQLRAVPQRGIGYGVLRYLAADGADLAVAPEVSFNYLGQVEAGAAATAGLFGGAREATGPTQDPRGLRRHVLEVSGVVEQGALELLLRYSPEWHDRATITRLLAGYLAALRALLAACQAPDAGGFTPSDFPLAQLNQEKLSKLSALIDKFDSAEE